MGHSTTPSAPCHHENKDYVRVLPIFAGEGCVWKCRDCGKKIIEKIGENFLSSAIRK